MASSTLEIRRRRQRASARRAILDATEALLVEGGADGLSMRRLAQRCGYTAPTIYHHFGDKPGLVRAVLEERFERLLRQLGRVSRSADPAETMRGIARAFIAFGLSHPDHYRLLISIPLDDSLPESVERARSMLEEPLHELFRAGRLKVDDVELASQMVWATSHGVISLQLQRPEHPFDPSLAERVIEMMIEGLVAPVAPGASGKECRG